MIFIITIVLALAIAYLFIDIHIERRRNRILQSFIAGIIKSISDQISQTDMQDISSPDDISDVYRKSFPIPYKNIIENVGKEFKKDFWMKPYWSWIKSDRNIFYDNKYANDGFNMLYWDFYDNEVVQIKKEHDSAG